MAPSPLQFSQDLKTDLFIVAGRLGLGRHDGKKFAKHALGREDPLPSRPHLFDRGIQDRLGRVDLVVVLQRFFPGQKLLRPVNGFEKAAQMTFRGPACF